MRFAGSTQFREAMGGSQAEAEGSMADFALGAQAEARAGALQAKTRALGANTGRKGVDWVGGLSALGQGLAGLGGSFVNGKTPLNAGWSPSNPTGALRDSTGVLRGTMGPNYGIAQR